MNNSTLVPCPGCGGRNPPELPVCDWCGRPFQSSGRHISPRWVRRGGSALFAAVVAAVVLLAVLNLGRQTGARPAPPTPSPAPSPTALARPTSSAPAGTAQTQDLPPTSTPTVAAPTPTATPEPLRTARIANTGGIGAFLRREPSAQAAAITALREGTVVTVLRREEVTAARVWRLVRDARGLEGWVLADYLEFLTE